jgi:hypothetical protein
MSMTIRCLLLMALGTGGSLLGGCAATEHMGVTPAKGFIFTHYRAPMTCRMEEPGGVPCGMDLKHGETSAHAFILPIMDTFHILSAGWGDAALDAAARDAGITTICYADYELLEVLGVYKSVTVHVYGK